MIAQLIRKLQYISVFAYNEIVVIHGELNVKCLEKLKFS